MRSIQPTRRRSSAGFWLGLLLIVLAGIGGIAALLWSIGLTPWTSITEDPFMVRIPINSRPIPAYEKVQREDLMHPRTGAVTFQKLPPNSVVGMSVTGISTDNTPVDGRVEGIKNDDGRVVFVVAGKDVPQSQVSELGGALMSVNAIIGRVVSKDKRAGMGFQESTFFPKGTPEGIAGATPPGMRAITLDATKLTGIHGLNSGNRLDLLASVPIGSFGSNSQPNALLTNSRPGKDALNTEPVLLARNALLLRSVTVRNETTTTSSLTSGKRQVNEPKYEVAIAVMPEDLIPLQNALDQSLKITCVATSMQPETEDSDHDHEHDHQLMAPVTVRTIPAYAVITREAFVSPATRTIRMKPVTERQIEEFRLSTRLEDMLGSIARHDIPAGSFVGKNDLMESRRKQQRASDSSPPSTTSGPAEPLASGDRWQTASLPVAQQEEESGANIVGDRPAVTSFVPPGRTAIAVPWNRIFGSEHLQIDDHLDLLASYPLERKRDVSERETRDEQNVVAKEYEEYVSRGTDRTRDESLAERGEPWFIATDAVVLGPVGFPPPNAATRAIGDAERQNTDGAPMSGPAILLSIDTRDLESMATVLNTPDVLLSVAFRAREDLHSVPAGFRQIAVAPVVMSAYSKFSDLSWKGLRRDITSRLVSANDPRFANAITVDQIGSYYGRVLNTSKERFAAFTPADFMPEGTQPGVAAAIGPNSVLVNVTSDQVQALNRFRNNDEVALLLTGQSEAPAGAVVHSPSATGVATRVIVQSARIVQAASDVSDTIALEISAEHASVLMAALFAHDATDEGDKHKHRLMAIARNRLPASQDVTLTTAVTAGQRPPIRSFLPLETAAKIYEVTGGEAKTHYFVNDEPSPTDSESSRETLALTDEEVQP